jgi:hypothetical protein
LSSGHTVTDEKQAPKGSLFARLASFQTKCRAQGSATVKHINAILVFCQYSRVIGVVYRTKHQAP